MEEHGLVLSRRENEVLGLITHGASNKHIARALELSVHTVKRHVARTMVKLQVSSRAQAASMYRGTLLEADEDNEPEASALDVLTARERDVLERIARGASNHQIATELALSLNTVKRHTANIREKLGVHSRVRAAALMQMVSASWLNGSAYPSGD